MNIGASSLGGHCPSMLCPSDSTFKLHKLKIALHVSCTLKKQHKHESNSIALHLCANPGDSTCMQVEINKRRRAWNHPLKP